MGQDVYVWHRCDILRLSPIVEYMNKLISSFAALGCAFVMVSCNDALDLTPLDRISDTEYFRDENDFQLFTNPLYNDMLPKTQFTKQSDLYVCQNLSDEMMGGTYRQVPVTGGGWSWGSLRRINTLIGRAGNCPDKAVVEKYTAVARFFRAYFYADMIMSFGDVPWYEEELGSTSPALYKPRDSRELVMTKIIEDIDYAVMHLPRKAEEAEAPYRVTKTAALALKSRFCLFEGTYRKYHNLTLDGNGWEYYLRQAADAADAAMNLGDNSLYTTGHPDTDYNILFAQDDASIDEYVLAISFRYGIFNNSHNANAHALLSSQARPGYTRKMVNMYLMADGSRFTDKDGWATMGFREETAGRDPRLAQSIRTPGYHRIDRTQILAPDFAVAITGYQPVKFVQSPDAAGGNTDRASYSVNDMPVIRYAEVLLNYAEAKAELGTITQDDLDRSVNLIRARVGMPDMNLSAANANPDPYLMSEDTGYPNVNGANKGVILEIRRERTVELVQEGFRWNDLLRWKCGSAISDKNGYTPLTGMYFPGPGEYDLSGDGNIDLILYPEGTSKPSAPKGVQVMELGKQMILTDGDKGYMWFHKSISRTPFNEGRDYLKPIPIHERSLNHSLTQNPGWVDGLDY